MKKITKNKREVKDLQFGLVTKIDFNNRAIEIYEVYVGLFVEVISNNLITIYNIERDEKINVIISEECNIYQYELIETSEVFDALMSFGDKDTYNESPSFVAGNRN